MPLNTSERSALIPGFFENVNGTTSEQTYAFLKDAYQRFDWKAGYIPNDLESRGFPVKDLDMEKYQNYAYGRNMIALWTKLRAFVASALAKAYPTDADVVNDKDLQAFSDEMRDPLGGAMDKFPEIKTIDELVDMVTMAIHIASPQHTAINYLQDYYQAFVPNKATCLCAPLHQQSPSSTNIQKQI